MNLQENAYAALPFRSYQDFRNPAVAESLFRQIDASVDESRHYRLMEFCGGHTHALFRHGLLDRLPDCVRMLHGPGCPVCVLPMSRIDMAIRLTENHLITLCTYGDMLRVPGSARNSLQQARAGGAHVEVIYSPADVITMAQQNPRQQFVFFAVGFETTTPPTAVLIQQAQKLGLKNLSVFCNHVLTPPAITGILEPTDGSEPPLIDGLLGPGHVSVISGTRGYQALIDRYRLGIVVAGFEPLDLLQAILMLIRQVNEDCPRLENQYQRAVSVDGNQLAQHLINQTFALRDTFEWRGLGFMPHSALRIRPELAFYDAEQRFDLRPAPARENKACKCPAVLRGQLQPEACSLFDNPCTPDNPIGSCMVSSEGACAAHYHYRRQPPGHIHE